MLASDGYLGFPQAYLLHELSGRPGKDSQTYGIHKQPSWGPVERRLGVAAVGPDTLLPVTGHALVTATRDDPAQSDPDRARTAVDAMERWGFTPPSSIADHSSHHLQLINDARGIVQRAVERRSPIFERFGLNPTRMLAAGFPRWLLCGRVQYGPRTSKSIATAGLIHEPGLDSALMWTAVDAGYVPVFRAGDSVSHPGPEISCLALLDSAKSLGGADLTAALYRGDTKAIPGMRWLTKPEVDVVAEQIDRRELPITLGDARVALIPRGLAIMGGKLLPVAGIVIATIVRTTLIVTPVDISGDAWVDAVVMALVAQQVSESSTWAACPSRFQQDCAIFEEQASSYHGRNGLRLIKTMSNLVVAGVARSAQAQSGP